MDKKVSEESDVFIFLNAKQKGDIDNIFNENYIYTKISWLENNDTKIREGFGSSRISLDRAIRKMFRNIKK